MAADSELSELYKRLATIEDDVDAGRYRPGPWESLLRTLRERPRAEREEIADAVARVSRKLHMRGGRRTIEVGSAITVELAATIAGAVLLIVAFATASNLLAIVSVSIWATTFQPLIKLACGRALGVRYDYAYLWALEPRLKMDFGSYIAAPRAARILLHLSGTVGSPLAVWIVWLLLPPGMALARILCWYAMWVLIGINAVTLIVGLAGIRRLGGFRMRDSSSGAAAAELREAVGLRA
ncbi:MAG TPA: hypothetical protein VEF07_01990 [Candidatus Binataceae bacterium]|nr:hypothetical protein [Candidatus Binataceae bacterium]